MPAENFEPSDEILRYLKSIYRLDWEHGIHGIRHWKCVLLNGELIAEVTGANLRVVRWFAYLHDICRKNDSIDDQHGARASHLIRTVLQKRFLHLPEDELDLLAYACEHHTDGLTQADRTVQACWDADRLDIGRVGMTINDRYLCCAISREKEFQQAAYRRSISG